MAAGPTYGAMVKLADLIAEKSGSEAAPPSPDLEWCGRALKCEPGSTQDRKCRGAACEGSRWRKAERSDSGREAGRRTRRRPRHRAASTAANVRPGRLMSLARSSAAPSRPWYPHRRHRSECLPRAPSATPSVRHVLLLPCFPTCCGRPGHNKQAVPRFSRRS